MIQEIIQQHPTLPVMCNAVTGEVCRTTGVKAYKWTKGCIHKRGYYKIYVDNRNIWVHRLIAETFLPNPDNKPTVDHINRVRTDNRLSNLRWATMSEQQHNTSRKVADYGFNRTTNPKEYYKAYNRAHAEDRYWAKKIRCYFRRMEKVLNW